MQLSLLLKYLFIFNVRNCFACMFDCVPHVCLVPEEAKRLSDPLELALQMIVSLHLHMGFHKSRKNS